MPDSLEKRLHEMGFSDQVLHEAAESIHENKTNKMSEHNTGKGENLISSKRAKSSKSAGSMRSKLTAGYKGFTKEELANIEEKI